MMLLIDGHIVDTERETPDGPEGIAPGLYVFSLPAIGHFAVANRTEAMVKIEELGVSNQSVMLVGGKSIAFTGTRPLSCNASEPKV